MEKKSRPVRLAPLQRVVAEPVTDPSEQTALDEQRHRQDNGVNTRGRVGPPQPEGPSPVVELCRQLSEEELPIWVMRMARMAADVLSTQGQLELLEELVTRLPADAARQLEEELRVPPPND
jgi:hypothetical protein